MGINRNFGTLTNQEITYAPRPLSDAQYDVWTDAAEIYLERGYKAIKLSDEPVKAGFYYTPRWTQTASEIVRTWEEHALPPQQDSPTELLDIITGEAGA